MRIHAICQNWLEIFRWKRFLSEKRSYRRIKSVARERIHATKAFRGSRQLPQELQLPRSPPADPASPGSPPTKQTAGAWARQSSLSFWKMCCWRKQEVLRSELDLCLNFFFWRKNTLHFLPNTKTGHRLRFSKVFQSIWSLNSHSNLKGLSGAQLIHANIQRQTHVSVSPEKLRVIHSEQESVASKYCPKSNKLRAAYPLLGVSLLWTKYCLEEQEYRFQGLDSSRQNLNRQRKS